MAALAVEIGRRKSDRPLLTGHLRGLLERFVSGFRWGRESEKRDQAILMTSAMLGAVILARATDDQQLRMKF